jgi:anti-sigma factor RsiW
MVHDEHAIDEHGLAWIKGEATAREAVHWAALAEQHPEVAAGRRQIEALFEACRQLPSITVTPEETQARFAELSQRVHDTVGADMIAYVKGELEPSDAARLEAALVADAGLAKEFQAYCGVLEKAGEWGPIEPTGAYRRSMEVPLREPLLDDQVAHLKGELDAEADAELRDRLRGQSALEAECAQFAAVLRAHAAIPALEPSPDLTARLHARLEKVKARKQRQAVPIKRHPGTWTMFTASYAVAAAAVLLFIGLTAYVPLSQVAPRADVAEAPAPSLEDQRRGAPRWEKPLDNRLDLTGIVAPQVDALRLITHADEAVLEECIVAYTPEDWDALMKNTSPEQAREMVARSVEVNLDQSQALAMPTTMIARMGGVGSQMAVLKLQGRIEIWRVAKLKRYLGEEPEITTERGPI